MSSQSSSIQPKNFLLPCSGEKISVRENNYYIGEILGTGQFSVVYSCTNDWGNSLAAKVLLPNNRPYDQIRDNWQKEFEHLIHLRHPNVTYIYDAFEHKNTFFLIMEQCFDTLEGLIRSQAVIGEFWVPFVAKDILQGLSFIHSRDYVHKDIHSKNIFVQREIDRMNPSKDPVLSFKVADLGIANIENNIRSENTVLANWMRPPESIAPKDFGKVGKCTDIYHTALLLMSLITKKQYFFTDDEIISGAPRQEADSLNSRYSRALSKALISHTNLRTQSALEFWNDIKMCDIPYS